MSQAHVTDKGYCTYCGAKLKQCLQCGEWFISTKADHEYCRSRCRTRQHRLLKKLKESSE